MVSALWRWCEAQCLRGDLLPSNPLSKALHYARARRTPLQLFLSDPEVPIGTNHLERALRSIPMGRRYVQFVLMRTFASDLRIPEDRLAEQCGFTCIIWCRLSDTSTHNHKLSKKASNASGGLNRVAVISGG